MAFLREKRGEKLGSYHHLMSFQTLHSHPLGVRGLRLDDFIFQIIHAVRFQGIYAVVPYSLDRPKGLGTGHSEECAIYLNIDRFIPAFRSKIKYQGDVANQHEYWEVSNRTQSCFLGS